MTHIGFDTETRKGVLLCDADKNKTSYYHIDTIRNAPRLLKGVSCIVCVEKWNSNIAQLKHIVMDSTTGIIIAHCGFSSNSRSNFIKKVDIQGGYSSRVCKKCIKEYEKIYGTMFHKQLNYTTITEVKMSVQINEQVAKVFLKTEEAIIVSRFEDEFGISGSLGSERNLMFLIDNKEEILDRAIALAKLRGTVEEEEEDDE